MDEDRRKLQSVGLLFAWLAIGLFCQFVYGEQRTRPQASEKQVVTKESPETTPEYFAGTYTIVAGEKDGEKVERHKLKATKVVIKGSRIFTLDKDDRELYVSDFRMQPHEKGFYITMESIQPPRPGISAIGLMQKKGKTVRLIYAFPDSEAPQDFQTVKGQHMFVLKRVDQSEDVRKVDAIPVN